MAANTDRMNYLLMFGVISIAAVASIVWFLNTYQLVDVEVRGDRSKEAIQNPFYAAELVLQASDVEVESVSGRERLHELPPTSDILLVNNLGPSLPPKSFEALLEWIRGGGHLITTARRLYDEDKGESGDQLLDELGVRLFRVDEEDEVNIFADNQAEDDDMGFLFMSNRNAYEPVEVVFESGETVVVNFNTRYVLEDSQDLATAQVGSEWGAHLVQLPVGEGMVTVMSDNRFLKNPPASVLVDVNPEAVRFSNSIAEADHAYYLWLLTASDSKVWILYSLETQGIFALLWDKARAFCISFIILLFVWLWWQYDRFGPHMARLDQPRRNLLEHIKMSANFSWRQDKGRQLLETNREQCLRWLCLKHPQLSQLSPIDQSERISTMCDIPANKIHQALYADWQSEREFISYTHIIQTLRKSL